MMIRMAIAPHTRGAFAPVSTINSSGCVVAVRVAWAVWAAAPCLDARIPASSSAITIIPKITTLVFKIYSFGSLFTLVVKFIIPTWIAGMNAVV
jgi:hypothetical protein